MTDKIKLLAVAGPTASGKTDLAVSLALRLSGEVISNDSMQVYRGMEIGTAAPTAAEMRGVPHHMIGTLSPDCDFSCADYADAARGIIDEVAARGRLPIMCGGTGLYLDAITSVSDFSEGVRDESLRQMLDDFAKVNGAQALHEKLSAVDPESAAAIHPNNIRRVIRAIEIFETTGITKTEWDRRSKTRELPYDLTVIVLDFESRQLLYDRIDRRVDKMLEAGLEKEVRFLWDSGLLREDKPAWQAIGYKEFVPLFRGECSVSEVAEEIKAATRRYAKRQITWFRRYPDAVRVHPDRDGEMRPSEELLTEVLTKIKA